MGKHRLSTFFDESVSLDSDSRLWILRFLVNLGGYRELVSASGYRDDALAKALGLPDPESVDFDEFSAKDALSILERDLERTENALKSQSPSLLRRNIDRLSVLVDLSSAEKELLAFGVQLANDLALKEVTGWLGSLPAPKLVNALSVVLEISAAEIRQALSRHGVLYRSGLLQFDWSDDASLNLAMEVLSYRFAQSIASEDAEPMSFLSHMARESEPPKLCLEDYPHLAEHLRVLVPYLRESCAQGRVGVNILIHGAPGTGKTQLAKILSKAACRTLFEVASEDSDGDPINGESRLRAYSLAQNLLPVGQSLIVFDEAEDVFGGAHGDSWRRGVAQLRKAWMNRILEGNRVPSLWLANSIDAMDPAFIRRFDMVLEVPVPPRTDRERLLKDRYPDLVDPSLAAQLAASDDLAPALISRAAETVRFIKQSVNSEIASDAFRLLIDGALQAQGHSPIPRGDGSRLPEIYDPSVINANADLTSVVNGLRHAKSGRLCLFGPPGTGKTAFGRWVADQLGLPCQVQKASDFLSKWVGESERNIARAFSSAKRDGAVLLIDEVDSFLRDRHRSESAWETTLVNEMLTQMEAFDGILIATTNLIDSLDAAALRRFDLKVKFDFMKPEQSVQLFERHCIAFGLSCPDPDALRRIRQLARLTPGDFASVSRQHRFSPIRSVDRLVDALEAECALKGTVRRPIGFLS